MFELSDPDRGLLEQTQVLRFRLKFVLWQEANNYDKSRK